jgi:hypothetical protein
MGEESQGVTKLSSAKIQGNLPFFCFDKIASSIPPLQSHAICETLARIIFCHIINFARKVDSRVFGFACS